MEFQDSADALKALQMSSLSLSGKKLVVKPRYTSRKSKPSQSAVDAESASGSLGVTTAKALRDALGVEEKEIMRIPDVSALLMIFTRFLLVCIK